MARSRKKGPRDIMAPAGQQPLTFQCKHYTDPSDMPQELAKYWSQRNDLWRRYDEDIYMTDDAWFGVTAEPIADEIAAELNRKGLSRPHGAPRVIVDLFAGAGGNTIAFARAGHWDQVIGIELDAPTLACAQHNAAVYGVADRITWIHGDCMDFLNRLKSCPWTLDAALQLCQAQRAGLVEAGTTPGTGTGTGTALAPLAENVELFASPPWGGPAYSGAEVLDLDAMEPFGVERLHRAMSPMAHALFLPRNGDLRQLANLVPNDAREKLDVVQYCINGGSKGLVVYYPIDEAYQDS